MSFEIVTDSSANLPQALIEENGLHILSLSYFIEDEEFSSYVPGQENDDLSYLYEKMRSKANIRTSLVNVDGASKELKKIMKEGKDVLYIGFSSGLSGTFQAVSIAADSLKESGMNSSVYCLDSLCASMGQGLLVYYACKLRKEGKSMDETVQWLEDNKLKMCHWFTVDDLFHLKRGGRISAVAAVFGSALSIKPVMYVDNEGHLQVLDKARGRKKSLDELIKHFKDTVVNPQEQVFAITHADCYDDAMYLREKMSELGPVDVIVQSMEPVIASHTGPGCIALFYLGDARP